MKQKGLRLKIELTNKIKVQTQHVLILFNKEPLKEVQKDFLYISEMIITVEMKMYGHSLVIIGVSAPYDMRQRYVG